MQSFFETELSEKMQRTCYATKTKETCERERLAYWTSELVSLERETKNTFDLNSFYNFYEMELSKKTKRLAAQKDQENI